MNINRKFNYLIGCSLTLLILIGCSKKLDECNSEGAKSNFERIVQKLLIDANKPKLRMKTINVIESNSGTKSGLQARSCIATIEWYYKDGDKEFLIEKTTLGFEISQNPINKDEIILIPDVMKLNLFYINELLEKGEELSN